MCESKDTRARFALGRCVTTRGAAAVFQAAADDPVALLARHQSGDWGDLKEEDKQANEEALKDGARILSAYHTRAGVKLWVITEADRSYTTILLPEEY